jgi:hypothetical protein
MPVTGIAPNTNLVGLGRGILYIDRFDADGNLQGYNDAGEVDNFSLEPNVEKIQLYSSRSGIATLAAEAVKKSEWKVSISGYSVSKANAGLILMGTAADFTQSSGTATDSALATSAQAREGGIYETGKRNITVTGVKQGATTLVVDDDYTVIDASAGLIGIPEGSQVTTGGGALTWSGSYAAIVAGDLTVFNAGTQSEIGCKLRFIPDNPIGPGMEVVCFNAALTPSGSFGLVSEDWIKFNLEGLLQTDEAGTYGGSASYPTHRVFYLG